MADQDEPNPEERVRDEAEADAGAGTGWNNWVRRTFNSERFLRPGNSSRASAAGRNSGRAGSSAPTGSDEVRVAVNTLDPFERRIGIMATIFELALTIVVVVPYLVHNHTRSASDLKTMSAVHVFLLEGIILFLFLLLGTIVKRRALLGFASLFVGAWLVQIKALSILGIAYVAFGMWLVIKGLKFAKGQGRTAARRPAAQPKPRRSRSNDSSLSSRSAPKPNKRYTPPKPPRRATPKKPAAARAETPKH
jgi:hypothetical protein